MSSFPVNVVRVNYDDAPNDVVNKVNVALTSYGLQLNDDNKEHEGFILCSLVDNAAAVNNEVGTLADQLEALARGYSASVRDNWNNIPDSQREPEALILAAFQAGAAMARVAIESRAKIAGLITAKSKRRVAPILTNSHDIGRDGEGL